MIYFRVQGGDPVCLGDQELMVSKEKEAIVVTEEFQGMHWRVPQVLLEHWDQ